MSTVLRQELLPFGSGAAAVQLNVRIPVRTCTDCGASFTDREAEVVRHEAVCRHLRVLTPREIRSLRVDLGMTRRMFADLTKLGEATIARWEAGAVIQNAAYDNLLRLLTHRENVLRLRGGASPSATRRARTTVLPFTPRFRELGVVPPELLTQAATFEPTRVM